MHSIEPLAIALSTWASISRLVFSETIAKQPPESGRGMRWFSFSNAASASPDTGQAAFLMPPG